MESTKRIKFGKVYQPGILLEILNLIFYRSEVL
jgi:hypothetical protein